MAGDNDRESRGWRAWFAALLRDRAGNVLILATAMLIPLTALVGSGIDIGRVYVARARMQQACDAASLAGRWAVSAGQSTANVTSEATKYFNFNYKQGLYGTAAFTPAVSITGTGIKTVTLTASTTMPMSIMSVFKFPPMTVAATCSASQDFVNTDILLVLDVTGSMMCLPSDDYQTCFNYVTNNLSQSNNPNVRSNSRMQGLRDAVMAFYNNLSPTATQLANAGMRMRFGVLPYAGTVNVGRLLYNQAGNANWFINPGTYIACTPSQSNCSGYASVTGPTRDSTYWNATTGFCIEERQTTSAITPTTPAIPSAANDLNIDMVPTPGVSASAKATQWQPYDASRQTYAKYSGCPVEAKKLTATWTQSAMQTYVNSLAPTGSTNHDVGMIWAARMLSTGGVFADSPTTYNSVTVNKYVIFMTDGQMETDPYYYSAYGTEQVSQRVTGGDFATQDDRHRQRFNLMCQALKSRGVQIWIVAFSTTPDANLSGCATDPGKVSSSNNTPDLIQKFVDIGTNIGSIRLTQ